MKLGYPDFLIIFNITNCNDWVGHSVKLDGVYINIPDENTLSGMTPQEQNSILSHHPTNNFNDPILRFPFTPEEFYKFLDSFPEAKDYICKNGIEQIYSNTGINLITGHIPNEEIGRRTQQITAILKLIKDLGHDPASVPSSVKGKVKARCLEEYPSLFTADGFIHAWKFASAKGMLSIENKGKYLSSKGGQ